MELLLTSKPSMMNCECTLVLYDATLTYCSLIEKIAAYEIMLRGILDLPQKPAVIYTQ
jgi:hypothetical protein